MNSLITIFWLVHAELHSFIHIFTIDINKLPFLIEFHIYECLHALFQLSLALILLWSIKSMLSKFSPEIYSNQPILQSSFALFSYSSLIIINFYIAYYDLFKCRYETADKYSDSLCLGWMERYC